MASYAPEQALVEPVITSWNSSWPNGLAAFLGGMGLGFRGVGLLGPFCSTFARM